MIAIVLAALTQDAEIERLGSDDLDAREEATRSLLAMGDKVVAKMVAALETEKPGERRSRLKWVLERTGAAAAEKKIRIEFVPPKKTPTRWDVLLNRARYKLRISNDNAWDIVVWTGFDLEITRDGKEVPECLAMWPGIRPEGCILDSRAFFLKVEAQSSAEFEEGVAVYQHEPRNGMLGWHLDVGEYRLSFSTEFRREAFRGLCKDHCASHADPDKPWNRAVEWKLAVTGALTVEAGAPLGCADHRKDWSDEAILHAVEGHRKRDNCAVCGEFLAGTICGDKHASPIAGVCLRCAVDKRRCVICAKEIKQ